MVRVNENYINLEGSYLFAEIEKRVKSYTSSRGGKRLIRLGIGDVTQPLVPSVIEALHQAVDEMGHKETFRGYAPTCGYEFLRHAIAKTDYKERGCDISEEEIFISDGAKSDAANLQELFSSACKVAVCDPVYPVYVDTNVMAGRKISYLPCLAENEFAPELPEENPDLIYLCFPNNPTGAALSKSELQSWVDYANKVGAVIIFDAAYEAYITESEIPHSIYECEGARTCAMELRSFSKNGGFTGLRLGATIIPKELQRDGIYLYKLWERRQSTKYNGTAYIVQRSGEAVYSKKGREEVKKQIAYYLKNAKIIREELREMGYGVYGGINAPYIWVKTPEAISSWNYFDYLLENAGVVTTPGVGFGRYGEGYVRFSAFGVREDVIEAMERMKGL